MKRSPRLKGFAYESRPYEKAIEKVNQFKQDFMVVTGDMATNPNTPAQAAELWRITKKLDPDIRVH